MCFLVSEGIALVAWPQNNIPTYATAGFVEGAGSQCVGTSYRPIRLTTSGVTRTFNSSPSQVEARSATPFGNLVYAMGFRGLQDRQTFL